MAFEADAAPASHAQFMEWYAQETQWTEGHSYDDPAMSTVKLRAWFVEITQSFPPLNGPLSQGGLSEDEASATDYSVGKSIIYCAFAWTKAKPAYSLVFELAQKHGVGFFNVSSGNEEVWLPSRDKLILAHSKELPENEIPRWVRVPTALVLALLTLFCGFASIMMLVVPWF